MIRYATVDDAEWIVSLMEANPDVCKSMPVEVVKYEIEKKMYILNDDDDTGAPCSFMRFVVTPNFIRVYLTLTEEGCRDNGHARLVYQYLYAKYQRPMRYAVEADSENEQIWAKRSEAVIAKTSLIGSFTSEDGVVYNEYLARYE